MCQWFSHVLIADCGQFNYPRVKSHKEGVRVVLHAGGGPTNSELPGNDGAAALEHWNLMTETQQTVTLRKTVISNFNKALRTGLTELMVTGM